MNRKTLAELVNTDDPAIPLIRQWAEASEIPCEILPPSGEREDVLLDAQVTTRSTLGALAYDTGGVLIDHAWLRFLGSGHPRLNRTLPGWNRGRSNGFYLVADDVVGGFFALNGGALGNDTKNLHYWAPDRLEWEPLEIGLTEFFCAALTPRLEEFYKDLRWPSWKEDVATVSADQCFGFFPFLWMQEGSIERSDRRPLPIAEAFDLKVDIVRQLAQ